MIIGVISFSFANGSLASIISQMDAQNGSYNEKLKILNKANKEFKLPFNLYISLLKQLKYESK
jgi:hypothetical protein